ncbi:MAG TPA: adenylate/guanylate cyclase domain-containing protein [Candidatus Limnocylindria bacterium]|nr:adenylate/guanylate cyclase domain-containing protein [Candidatus Limnocylindria bacterium]
MPGACPDCGAPAAPGARFCASCGASLGGENALDSERRARLAAAAPTPLAEKMRAPRRGGERRVVTALFADVVGSTALTESMDPEDWTALVNEAFDAMSRAIYRYEGTIARLMGDAILAFFGAPVAHEDDPERAVRCALDMVHAIDERIGARTRRERGLEFRIRAGVNTGEVVVGEVGSDLMYEYTAMGDAVNVAARMQSMAAPGTVLVTAATYRFVAPVVEAVDRGAIEIKGKTERIRAYEISGVRAAPGRMRGLAGIESALVGRDAELGRLLEAFSVVRAGQGRVAFVLGDAGLGKSRLLAEFQRAASSSGKLRWAEARCLSYGMGMPFHLIVDLLRSLSGVAPTADEHDLAVALDHLTRDLLGDDWADPYAYLAHLAGLPLAPDLAARITAIDLEVLKRYVSAIHVVVRAMASRTPLVLVYEDVHWADASSVDLILQLLPLVNELPLFCLVTARPERTTQGWRLVTAAREGFGDALVELPLAPLSADDSRRLVGNLLDIESLPDAVRDLILAKAEGNPFFVEEVIRMLIERGGIAEREGRWVATGDVGAVEIPDTLQGLLLARIDRLPKSARQAIRTASVIGRQFPVRVLDRVLGPTDRS